MEHCIIRSSTRLLQYAALLYSISSYRCRGTVWAVPPDARGKIFDTKKNRYVVTEVSLNTVDENAIKDRILHAVWDLWTSHAEAIYRAMYGAFARAAADITPQIAAQLYAEQYPMLGYRRPWYFQSRSLQTRAQRRLSGIPDRQTGYRFTREIPRLAGSAV